jgi:tetratricopeptide (TPR) repeat protein
VAKYKKKRARELEHDKFRDAAGKLFDRLGDLLEGKGRMMLYGLLGVVVLGALIAFWVKWSHRKQDEARQALGRAIEITQSPIADAAPAIGSTTPTFSNEQERAKKAIEEFEKVAAKYGDPYRTEARYFIATNLLTVDREKGIQQLAEISKSNVVEAATLGKLALAQAKEADGKLDEAAQLYRELAQQNSIVVTSETANLMLASVYIKQGKKQEAADLLFNIVEASRKAKDTDGTPLKSSEAARKAAEKLQTIDPGRYAKLTPEVPSSDIGF